MPGRSDTEDPPSSPGVSVSSRRRNRSAAITRYDSVHAQLSFLQRVDLIAADIIRPAMVQTSVGK